MTLMKPNILYPATVTDANALYLATGRLDDMPCAIEVTKEGDGPDVVEIMLNGVSLRLSKGAATELGRHLSAAAAIATRKTGDDCL